MKAKEQRAEKRADKRTEKRAVHSSEEQRSDILAGRHAIVEAIKAGRGSARRMRRACTGSFSRAVTASR